MGLGVLCIGILYQIRISACAVNTAKFKPLVLPEISFCVEDDTAAILSKFPSRVILHFGSTRRREVRNDLP